MKAVELLMKATQNLDNHKKIAELLRRTKHELAIKHGKVCGMFVVRVVSLIVSIDSGSNNRFWCDKKIVC